MKHDFEKNAVPESAAAPEAAPALSGPLPPVGHGSGIDAIDQQQRPPSQQRDPQAPQNPLPYGGNGRAGHHVISQNLPSCPPCPRSEGTRGMISA